MAFKTSRRELGDVKKDIEHLLCWILPYVGGDFQRAQELLFTTLQKFGSSPVEMIRRGQTEQARVELLDLFKRVKAKREFEQRKILERKQRSLLDF